MDTSKEYIKMCEAAEEIQDSWHMYNGDFFYSKNGQNSPEFCISIWLSGSKLCDSAKDKTWLPRQDQLQDRCRGQTIFDAIDDFHRFVFILAPSQERGVMITKRCAQFTTAEQLWLAFLMHSTLQKRWNGEKWEKCQH